VVATRSKDPETDASEVEAEKPEATGEEANEEAVEVAEDADADAKADDVDEADRESDDSDVNLRLKGNQDNRDKGKRSMRPWGRYARRSVLPLLLVASLAVSGFLGWKQWQEHQAKLAGQQAQQAAVAYAQVLTSIDSNKVDENFRQVLDGATGEFKDMYTQSSVQLRQLLIDNKATAHGVVVDSAIQSESTNKVVVLVFIDQTVTNTQAPDPRIDRSRIKMTMEKIDGHWRASKVQLL
jgi:Mce-associated membrane protein